MKKFVFLISIILLLAGCKTNRKATKSERSDKQENRVEHVVDKSVKAEQKKLNVRSETLEGFWERVKRTEYDSEGNITAVEEIERGRDTKQTVDEQQTEEIETKSDVETSKNEKIVEDKKLEEKETQKNDSRPVQGIEWVWVILGVAIVIFVGYRIFLKR